jgi:hypothetical protein
MPTLCIARAATVGSTRTVYLVGRETQSRGAEAGYRAPRWVATDYQRRTDKTRTVITLGRDRLALLPKERQAQMVKASCSPRSENQSPKSDSKKTPLQWLNFAVFILSAVLTLADWDGLLGDLARRCRWAKPSLLALIIRAARP